MLSYAPPHRKATDRIDRRGSLTTEEVISSKCNLAEELSFVDESLARVKSKREKPLLKSTIRSREWACPQIEAMKLVLKL